ncbi:protein arginine methyltransferase 10, partial [Perkinsus olseni]
VVVTDSLGRGGHWYSHSHAATKEELVSHSPITEAKLCYSYGQHNNYHAHVGRVTFVDPPQMTASIHLTARQLEARAPVIVEFRTGGDPAANPMYGRRPGDTQLIVQVQDSAVFDLLISTDEALTFEEATAGDIDISASRVSSAKQSACGQVIREMWTDHPKGFPIPKGCWYRTHGRKRSIGIVFDSRNGLADNSTYQLVFNAVVHEAALQANTAHLWIFSMDYIATSPYTVLELGKA